MTRGKEQSSPVKVLIPGLLCCLLALIGVAMAIGAVVPAVGDAMNVNSRGVGGMFGYLFGTLFFGGLGVGGLWLWRRDQKRANTPRGGAAEPAELADPVHTQDHVPLPQGPGLGARWAMAVPLMLVTSLVPTLGQVTVTAWWRVSFRESLPDILGRPDLMFWDAFRDGLANSAYTATLPVLVLVVFLVRRTMFAAWPKACLWLAVFVIAPSMLVASAMGEGSVLPNLALGVGLIWLNYELGKLTLWRLSRPVAQDIALSELEIPYRVPDSRARLRVQRDRLKLDRLTTDAQKKTGVHKTILWADLTGARLEHVTEPTRWQASSGTAIEVPSGPALRLTSADENWLLPVPELLGEDLVTAITLRATARRGAEKAR